MKIFVLAAFIFATVLIGFGLGSYAAEQRCTDLGANCVCSEPLNTNSFTQSITGGGAWYNPVDSTTKECKDGYNVPAGGAVLVTVARDLFGSNSGEEITNLPAGHTNTWVSRRPNGHAGGWETGAGYGTMPPGKARFAARWYIYYSAVYDFAFENACTNGTIANILNDSGNHGLTLTAQGGVPAAYNFIFWTPSQDCCNSGPARNFLDLRATGKGKWWRFEVIVMRPNGDGNAVHGTGTVVELYMKNVTDNGPELKVIDTTVTTQGNPILLAQSSADKTFNLRPFSSIIAHPYRAGTCAGFNAISHYMAAAWDTDAGQRIGAAVEIEGRGPAVRPEL
jgi:hypothetical protein